MSRYAISIGVWMVMVVLAPLGYAAGSDVVGSHDLPEIERYPLSYIVDYQQRTVPEYRLALGSMQKVNGVLAPERSRAVRGELTRVTYRIPAGHSSRDAYEHVKRQVLAKGGEALFECQGRDCGSSSDWANDQFEISKLYGIDREQYYLAASLKGTEGYLAIYAVRRGNRRVYLHIDQVRDEAGTEALGVLSVVRALSERQRVYLPVQADESRLGVVTEAVIQLMNQDPTLKLLVVGHTAELLTPERSLDLSRSYAQQVRAHLVAAGVDSIRVSFQGVGALAPSYDEAVETERVELLLY